MPSKEKGGEVSPGVPHLSVETVRRDADECVLAVSGGLSIGSAAPLRMRLAKVLAAVGRVLVDLSGLRVVDGPAVQVFPVVLAALGGWPEARLVLFAAGPDLARTLGALRVPLRVPVAPDEAAARLLLDRRPPVVVRTKVADELGAELAEATSAITPDDPSSEIPPRG